MDRMAGNVMIVGVGGQGTLLASKILGSALQRAGYDVKVSEVHGMSQRGGSVVTYVRYGKAVHSPIIEKGEADYILAFEQLEAARYLPYLKRGGVLIVNDQRIDPMPVITGAAQYPQNILQKLGQLPIQLRVCDAVAMAEQVGNGRAVNVALIGVLAAQMPFDQSLWEQAIADTVPQKFAQSNLQAFSLAYASANEGQAVSIK